MTFRGQKGGNILWSSRIYLGAPFVRRTLSNGKQHGKRERPREALLFSEYDKDITAASVFRCIYQVYVEDVMDNNIYRRRYRKFQNGN